MIHSRGENQEFIYVQNETLSILHDDIPLSIQKHHGLLPGCHYELARLHARNCVANSTARRAVRNRHGTA